MHLSVGNSHEGNYSIFFTPPWATSRSGKLDSSPSYRLKWLPRKNIPRNVLIYCEFSGNDIKLHMRIPQKC